MGVLIVASRSTVRRTLLPDDPVARALTWSTMSSALSRGVFFSVSVLFFTRVAGLTPTTVGFGLTIAGAAAVAASLGAGYLAGLVGARRVLLFSTAGQGLALLAYLVVSSPTTFVGVACAAVGQQAMQRTALNTMIAQSFTGPERVEVRARLRVVMNCFIGAGTALAAVVLAIGTRPAYLLAMASTAALLFVSALSVRRVTTPGPSGPPRVTHRRRSPLSDRTYLAATALNAVMTMQFGMLTVGVPLWIAGWTTAPAVTVAVLLALNTVIVSLLQVWAARGARDLPAAGRSVAGAGALLAVACGLYAAATYGGVAMVVVVLALATVAHSLAEVVSEAGSWTLAFELADPDNAGAYQGVSQTGAALGSMLAPLVVTATAIEHGRVGWVVLAALFLAAGLSTRELARRQAT
ncbi:MFS transporter [Phytohabitans aurantiacus]|uniref:MFS transporter n=1 Tax=Phytohabitans aurantiacus TaxID=3016789 RepID=A0ABQ5QWH3_9ACTN|nr:MFS transporter [Phytohabitans aurantiacus]